jgi:hypothetical protein
MSVSLIIVYFHLNVVPTINEGEANEEIFKIARTYRYGAKRGTRFINHGIRCTSTGPSRKHNSKSFTSSEADKLELLARCN